MHRRKWRAELCCARFLNQGLDRAKILMALKVTDAQGQLVVVVVFFLLGCGYVCGHVLGGSVGDGGKACTRRSSSHPPTPSSLTGRIVSAMGPFGRWFHAKDAHGLQRTLPPSGAFDVWFSDCNPTFRFPCFSPRPPTP